ncbi:MAG: sle [Acidimicrobiales bacterium]|nr:sle [Acidimicrobiales bacterium]
MLAYNSGVSWPAIAQIESGRRRDIRLSTLAALADALHLSVDYLIGTESAIAPKLFQHQVLSYASDEEFLEGAVPFLIEGITRSHSVLAVTTQAKTVLLRDALDDRAEGITFADWADWYRSPRNALARYTAFVKDEFAAGANWIRVVAEAAWEHQSEAEIAAWTRYESLVNIVFASSPATIVCTYDTRLFPIDACADACRTHPMLTDGGQATVSPTYRSPEDFLIGPTNE